MKKRIIPGQHILFDISETKEDPPPVVSEKVKKSSPTKATADNPYLSMSITDKLKVIESLRKAAASCIEQAKKINTEVSGNWTHRRQSFADSAQKKKDTLMGRSTILYHLAEDWQTGNLNPLLFKIRSKTDIDFVFYNGFPQPPDKNHPTGGWYREEYPDKKKKADSLWITSEMAAQAMSKLLKDMSVNIQYDPEDEKKRELREKLKVVHAANIPGFFPTPDVLIDKMIDYAQLKDGMTLLEPSAGIGSILDRIKEHGFELRIDAVEYWPILEEILRLKGYNSSCEDILATDKINGKGWDRILMNPPFEKGMDMVHVKHCFDTYLKPGGILVSIMSSGVMTNTLKKHEDFRAFVEDNNGEFIKNGRAFKEAFVSTGVSSVMLVLRKE